jgi:sensor domain CHASE-containing protein
MALLSSLMSMRAPILIIIWLNLLLTGCGYRLAGAKMDNGRGQTLAIPTFANGTTIYRLEQRLSEAVRREFVRRTRFEVITQPEGDVVVDGEVIGFSAVPIIFNQQGRGSAYSILVDLKVTLTDTRTGAVVFQNDRWTFRDVFELAQNSAEYISEDTAAMDRLARRFASSLVASMMHTK